MSKRTRRTSIAFLAALAMGAFAPAREVSLAVAPSRIVVIAAPFLPHAPFFLALENGDFEREGVAVEFVRVGRSADSMVALLSGQADVLLGNATVGFLNMVAKGEKARIVADKGYVASTGCVESGVLVRKAVASRLKTAQSARGLRCSVSMASPSAYHLELNLNDLGLALEDLDLLGIPNPDLAGAFQTGSIDMAHAGEPWFSQSMRTGQVELWRGRDRRIPGGVVIFAPRLLGKDRGQGLRFLRGYLRGVARLREGKTPQNIEILARRTGLAPDLIENACWPEVGASARIDPAPLQGLADWARKRGYMVQGLDAARTTDLTLLDEIASARPSPY